MPKTTCSWKRLNLISRQYNAQSLRDNAFLSQAAAPSVSQTFHKKTSTKQLFTVNFQVTKLTHNKKERTDLLEMRPPTQNEQLY